MKRLKTGWRKRRRQERADESERKASPPDGVTWPHTANQLSDSFSQTLDRDTVALANANVVLETLLVLC